MNKDMTVMLHTGNEMPIMGLGTWHLTHDTPGTIERALELGYKMIDTSSDYGTQPGVGEGIKRSGVARDKIYIVTKVEETDDSYERTLSNLEELKTDYIDLMLIHRPPEKGAGRKLWEGLIKARDEGLVTDIGVSNYSQTLIDSLIEMTGETPVVNQIEWSPFGHSNEMIRYSLENSIIIQAYSPLTRGEKLDDLQLKSITERYGKSPAQILIRWNLQLGSVPLPKANKWEHLEENINVFDFVITENDMEMLNEFNKRQSFLGHLPYL